MLTPLFPNTHARYTSLPVLGPVLEPLCSWLEAGGYPPSAICRRLEAAPFLDQWLRQQRMDSLSGHTAEQLRACLPRQKRWTPQIAYALGRSLLQYLTEQGRLEATPPTVPQRLLAAYRQHLQRRRGFAPATIARHAVLAGDFLRFLHYEHDERCLPQIQAGDLEAFLIQKSQRLGRITMQKVVAVLRSFLQFLAASGQIPVGLDRRLESPRQYRGQQLVRALPWEDVLTLLRGIDRSTIKGCRDYAMLLLIATYGLRRSEVASLEIGDLQWRAGVIRVPRPKVGTPLVLPLTEEIGTALLAYLRQRAGKPSERRLFLRVRAPQGPIESTAVSDVFDAWAQHAGVHLPGLGGPHALRPGLAMHLLRQGTPLKTIGDLLGHRSAESTGIYLRLEVEDLRDVALSLLSAHRRCGAPRDNEAPLLVHHHRGRFRGYTGAGLGHLLKEVMRVAGIRTSQGRVPRVHDLRFTFAVQALSRWYRAGVDVQTRLPALATYPGHVSVVSTQYYLTFWEATAVAANERFYTHMAGWLSPERKGGRP